MEEHWTPKKSKCEDCEELVEAGIMNWIKHYDKCHPTKLEFRMDYGPELIKEFKKILSEQFNTRTSQENKG